MTFFLFSLGHQGSLTGLVCADINNRRPTDWLTYFLLLLDIQWGLSDGMFACWRCLKHERLDYWPRESWNMIHLGTSVQSSPVRSNSILPCRVDRFQITTSGSLQADKYLRQSYDDLKVGRSIGWTKKPASVLISTPNSFFSSSSLFSNWTWTAISKKK